MRHALHRSESGHCERVELVLGEGGEPEPMAHGHLERVAETVLRGWGDLDGPADIWEPTTVRDDLVKPALLVPRQNTEF